MSSLIKNQILKHLTKFFKDIAPEQLQMNALMGSCELSNLKLNESVLMNLLELPLWLRITTAVVDKIYIKITWTKIKSVPILMNLNEVTVQVEVCDEFRNPDLEKTDIAHYLNLNQPPSKYGFVDRVIDGITVMVNNINISFNSKLMAANFNLSRVLLESRCPNWKQGELSLTRLKDANFGQILLFKVIEWHTMRLEAKCLTDPSQAPLRLITNFAQCRITIKKKLEDCSVISARIFLIFEDILWILTFAQFISASAFVEYIFSLIKRSPIIKKNESFSSKKDMAQFDKNLAHGFMSPINTPGKSFEKMPILTGNMSSASLLEQKFRCYDIVETSLHLYMEKIDAHLYDDIEPKKNSKDCGGAIQLTLNQINLDCYPYSMAMGDRRHWYKWFDPSPSTRRQWLNSHFSQFEKLSRMSAEEPPSISHDQLLSLTVLVRIKDFCMNCVTTESKESVIKKFIQIDKDYQMPADMPSLYLELDYFYYFDATRRMMVYEQVPDPVAFLHLSPTKLLFDSPTILFLNSFHVNLTQAFVKLNNLFPQDSAPPKIHFRVEILMPQLSLPSKSGKASKLLIKSGKITWSNSLYDEGVIKKLAETINKLDSDASQHINLSPKNFGNVGNSVWDESIIDYIHAKFSPLKQLWAFQLEPFWLDFLNHDSNELQPVVEPVKIYIFLLVDLMGSCHEIEGFNKQDTKKRDIISVLITLIDEPVIANLDKTEFKFLKKFFAHFDKFLQQMKKDISNIIKLDHEISQDILELHLAAYLKQLRTRVLFDKNSNDTDTNDDIPNESYNRSGDDISPNTEEPLDQPAQIATTLSAESSRLLNPRFDPDTISVKDRFEFSHSYQKPSSVIAVQDDGTTVQVLDVGDCDDLDECTEMAEDASCFLLGNEQTTPEDERRRANSITTSSGVVSSLIGDDAGRSSIQEKVSCLPKKSDTDLLSSMEESSKIFAKVSLQPKLAQNLIKSNRPLVRELDPSSYFEMSLSQLVFKTNALS